MDLKQKIIDEKIFSYAWLPTDSMWADISTKEKMITLAFGEVIAKNNLSLGDTAINKVKAFGQEVWIKNIRNCTQSHALEK